MPKPNQRKEQSIEDRRENFRNNATQALLDKSKAQNEKIADKGGNDVNDKSDSAKKDVV